MQRDKKHNIVYKTTNLINGKIYIGVHSTDNLDDKYIGSGKLLRYTIKKYGSYNFSREILYEFGSIELCYWWESYLVDKEFIKRDENYNTRVGGLHSYHKEDTGLKISKALTGKPNKRKGTKTGKPSWNRGIKTEKPSWNRGIPATEEAKKKLSESKKGKKMSETAKKNMSISHIGRKLSEEHKQKIALSNARRKYSKETLLKMSNSANGRKNSEEHKRKISEGLKGRKFPNGYKKKDNTLCQMK